ncbi:Nucleoside-diphosphate-sugar epimerase [Pseudomonas sp. NFACC23-1]|uniref:NAD-dependent epimerase/dehydratase family protein n=1 Tax=unclassified Pseudomonas TaxID=196821 RepID=UPI00087FE2A0|nr:MULTISPECIES: NAD-dependent epimerase/dehydratase family protein [unclassified Pseudomonas]SDB07144.1 Nucleoside-diphosphate-sugar epimerase [Pseudomonas sp. NFACC17-2]SEI96402.1 Nucleoside-diphosphate-sugar epimerase [Pseudomonas sp. NFACC23-1]SFW33377.1 Nucleoside-diphosphate-sugar epimerase [Pseudomonas sp. NFACC16-2]
MTSVLITGSGGFIGRGLVSTLTERDFSVTAVTRTAVMENFPGSVIHADLKTLISSIQYFHGIDCIVHLAGRAHILNEVDSDPLAAFRDVNRDLTVALARIAVKAGVKRFIFMSSIGVNGTSSDGRPFDEASVPSPQAAYALSKLEAEDELRKLLAPTAVELVIIRPPMVYAAHAPGNFQRLLKLAASGIPLPFASINNRRSMIALENLVDFIALCIDHPSAADELYLISDGTDVSTPDIVRHLCTGLRQNARLIPVPTELMRLGAFLIGKQAMYTQLCDSLLIDSSKARNQLGWKPKLCAENALIQTGRKFAELRKYGN